MDEMDRIMACEVDFYGWFCTRFNWKNISVNVEDITTAHDPAQTV